MGVLWGKVRDGGGFGLIGLSSLKKMQPAASGEEKLDGEGDKANILNGKTEATGGSPLLDGCL